MGENIKEHVIATLKSLMKPIIMLFLRNGVTYKEFASLCKSIFVEAAAQDYGIRGRPTNVSRISVLTGIDRKEVKRLKDLLRENKTALEAQSSQDRITRLLTAWHKDPDFIDEQGQPKKLPVSGDSESFQLLVRRFGGDIPWQTFMKELLRVGAIEQVGNILEAKTRYFFPSQKDPGALLRAGSVISELGETLFHNLYVADESKPGAKNRRHFERRASNNLVSVKHQKAFHEFLEIEGQEFLEKIDNWLTEHEYTPADNETEEEIKSSEKAVRLGVGLFSIAQEKNTD